MKAQGPAAEALAARRPELLVHIAEIKRFYGLREQRLERLLFAPAASTAARPWP
ncbi:MAG: hypothetical protein V3V71_05355 [Roseateles sp.]|nr:hypothetical protein [Burkholderiaceae bacterium]